jgi:hypothetical protein
LYKSGAELRELNDSSEILVPAVAGWGVVARGFGFIIGASEGCGGGVARCRSSLRMYVPAILFNFGPATGIAPSLTFTNNQLILRPRGVREGIVRLDHRCRLSILNSKIIRSLGRVSRGWW